MIAAKMAAAARVNGDQIANDSLAELDSLTNSDMVSALATIVAGGNRATQSLSDAFASANKEFGMADRMIGGYQVTDQLSSRSNGQVEETTKTVQVEETTQSLSDAFASANKEFGMADRMIGGYQVTDQLSSRSNGQVEETTKTVQVEETIKMAQVEEMLPAINVRDADGRAYQLSLLLEPTRSQNTYQAELDSHQNGHQNGSINDHHNGHKNTYQAELDGSMNGHHNGHQNTYQAELDGSINGHHNSKLPATISPPQLEMVFGNKSEVLPSKKRRRRKQRGASLFDWLELEMEK